MNQSPDLVLKPIGVVPAPIREVTDDCWGGVAATIALDSQLFGPEPLRDWIGSRTSR